MSSSLKVSMAGFEVDLVEFAGVISDLVSVNLDQESKAALKTLIGEARKSFDVVVDVITPLYALNTPVAVRDQFPALRATFARTPISRAVRSGLTAILSTTRSNG